MSLSLFASDEVSPPFDSSYPLDALMRPPADSATRVTEMRFSNSAGMSGGTWEPFVDTNPWTLAQSPELATIYVQCRDAAGNESLIVPASIWIGQGLSQMRIMLPIVMQK